MSEPLPTVTRRVLEAQKVGCTVAGSARYRTEEGYVRDELWHHLSAYLLVDRIAQDSYEAVTHYSHPGTTWQMFKHRNAGAWWLRWLVRRWPVAYVRESQTVVIDVERCLTYPEAAIELRSLGRPYVFETARRSVLRVD